MRAGLRAIEHSWSKHRGNPEDLLSEPVSGTASTTRRSQTSTFAAARAAWSRAAPRRTAFSFGSTPYSQATSASRITRPGRAPFTDKPFLAGATLAQGSSDAVCVELRADPIGSEYQWTWTTELRRAAQPDVIAARFRQSEFLALPLATESLRKRAETFTPGARIDRCGGALRARTDAARREKLLLSAIAIQLQGRFSEQFEAYGAALDSLLISERYAE